MSQLGSPHHLGWSLQNGLCHVGGCLTEGAGAVPTTPAGLPVCRGAEPTSFLSGDYFPMNATTLHCLWGWGGHILTCGPGKVPTCFTCEIVASVATFPYLFLSACISFSPISLMYLFFEHLLCTVTWGTSQYPRPGPCSYGAHSLQGDFQTLTQTFQML